ncbi:MAG: TadE/TadG family type IV pilus assembly protein [Candidatus Hinthialibacter antarcticus]|nr:TadE/TadG family type IV pilus assembly protein [Candidatus Hinthialibacter antarcticus]
MNSKPKKAWNQGERGSATVEFALVLPILMLMLFGIIEFGRVLSVQHLLNTAVREGARMAALPGADNATVIAKVNEVLSGAGVSYDGLQLTPADVSSASRNDPVTVRVQVNYESVAWVGGIVPGFGGTQLQGVVVMRKEGFI